MNRQRRSFIAGSVAAGLTAAVGPAKAARSNPLRIATFEWSAAETLLALGATPVCVGEPMGYDDWVVEPPLPSTVRDIGSRFEPNRELLKALSPELIIVTNGYGFSPGDWQDFAPVHELFPNAPEGVGSIMHARAEMFRLADRIDRLAEADACLQQSEQSFEADSEALLPHKRRPVAIVTIFEERTARIYGGGLVNAVLDRVGLRNAWTLGGGPWGFAQIGFEKLALLPEESVIILLDPIPPPVRLRLEASSLWNNLPFVRAGNLFHIAPVWPFGGLVAANRLARLLSNALTTGA